MCVVFRAKADTEGMRVNIIVPDEWLPLLQRHAKRQGKSLSRLLCDAAFDKLPRTERGKLPPARERGRPKKEI
jgi:hypothetical protein